MGFMTAKAVSLGGGEGLKGIGDQEVRLNRLAVAAQADQADIYSAMMHYIQGGLSPGQALQALEAQYVQGKRGAYELRDLAHGMPGLLTLGRDFGLTPQQAATDTSAMLQLFRESTGKPGVADTLARHVMTKLGDPKTADRISEELGIDVWKDREAAKASGANPLFHLMNTIADEQKAGNPKVMGAIARDLWFRQALDSWIQHRAELGRYQVSPEDAAKASDEDYAAQNSTVAAERQAAETAKQEAAIRAGRTQRGVMTATAAARKTAWEAGGSAADALPVTTGIVGAALQGGGNALSMAGTLGETAIGLITAYKGAQYLGAKFPALGGAADAVGTFARAPIDLGKGLTQGIYEGIRQGIAEVQATKAAPVAAEPASANPLKGPAEAPAGGVVEAFGKAAAEAGTAATGFGAAASSLGSFALMAQWAAQRDVGIPKDVSEAYLRDLRDHPERHRASDPLTARMDAALAALDAARHPAAGGPPTASAAPPASAAQPGIATAAGALSSIGAAFDRLAAAQTPGRGPPTASAAPPASAAQPGIGTAAAALGSIAAAFERLTAARTNPQPAPTAANQPAPVQNNQKYITAPISVSAPISIHATLNNTTPAAIGAAVLAGAAAGVRAGAAALHDGTETK